ncbi:MAG: cobalamin B12-binding domain-containing protein [Deltaproteobacteria bacterium]|nr:cobalamin B12-binding domain-containing protein [Deltaproteobacteria bacterium]
MARIFLATPPHPAKERYGPLAAAGANLPSLGILSLAAVCEAAGHRVSLADAVAEGLSEEEVIARVAAFSPDVLGLSATTPVISRAGSLAGAVRKRFPGLFIVLGGPHATALPEGTLSAFPAFDAVVIGEGEAAFSELVSALSAKRPLSGVSGLALRANGAVTRTACRTMISDLDSLPFPAWHLLPGFPRAFRPAVFNYRKSPSAHCVTSRGCAGACTFCDRSVFGRTPRFHSAFYMAELSEMLVRRHGVRELVFEDDQFLADPERIETFCRILLDRRLNLDWSAAARAGSVRDAALLDLMKKAGCWRLSFGLESADEEVLTRACKGTSPDMMRRAVTLTRRTGMEAKGFFILGLPGETEESMARTISFAKSLPLCDCAVFFATPFPGTAIYDGKCPSPDFSSMNLLTPHPFSDGPDLEALVAAQRRFARAFYLRRGSMGRYLGRAIKSPKSLLRLLKAGAGFFKFTITAR